MYIAADEPEMVEETSGSGVLSCNVKDKFPDITNCYWVGTVHVVKGGRHDTHLHDRDRNTSNKDNTCR